MGKQVTFGLILFEHVHSTGLSRYGSISRRCFLAMVSSFGGAGCADIKGKNKFASDTDFLDTVPFTRYTVSMQGCCVSTLGFTIRCHTSQSRETTYSDPPFALCYKFEVITICIQIPGSAWAWHPSLQNGTRVSQWPVSSRFSEDSSLLYAVGWQTTVARRLWNQSLEHDKILVP